MTSQDVFRDKKSSVEPTSQEFDFNINKMHYSSVEDYRKKGMRQWNEMIGGVNLKTMRKNTQKLQEA